MYFENEKHYARQRSNDEFLRRMHADEFVNLAGRRDVPTLARTDVPGKNERPGVSCDGTRNPQGEAHSLQCKGMPSLAMVYSPVQEWKHLLSPQEGLAQGTIFAELILPFEGASRKDGCGMEGGCRK